MASTLTPTLQTVAVYINSSTTSMGTRMDYNLSETLDNVDKSPPHPLQNLLMDMKLYYIPTLVTVGCIGNIIASLTLLRTSLRYQAWSHYMAASLASDTLFLSGLILVWLAEVDLDVYNVPGGCQFLSFLNNISAFLSLWFVTSYAVDLSISILWPQRTISLSTPLRAKIVILSLVTVAIAVYTNLSLTFGVFTFLGRKRCSPHPMFLTNLQWLSLFDGIFNILIPYIVIFVVIILTAVIRCHAPRGGHSSPSVVNIIQNTTSTATFKKDSALSHGMVLALFLLVRITNEAFRFKHILRMVGFKEYPLSKNEFYWQQITQYVFYVSFSWKLLVLFVCLSSFRKSLLGVTMKRITSVQRQASHDSHVVDAENEEFTAAKV